MVYLAASALLLLAPAILAHSVAPAKRQAETVALTALTSGPVSYVSVLASVSALCTSRCAPMIASSTTCTEDSCACAASAQTVTCMNCLLESATTAQGATVTTGFNTYAQACVDEGYLGVVPVLNQAAGGAVTSSSASLSSSSVRTSSVSTSASRTSTAPVAGSTAGYLAFSSWVTAVGNAVCTTDCAPALNAFAACSATDTCICTTTNFAYGATCNACLNLNAEGYWTTGNLQQIASLWETAGTACNIAVAAAPAPTGTTTRRTTTNGANTLRPVSTGAPQQSYFAPSTTATTTTAPPQRGTGAAAAGSSNNNSPGSAGERGVKAAGLAGAAGAVGWALLAIA